LTALPRPGGTLNSFINLTRFRVGGAFALAASDSPKGNPRRTVDRAGISSLAESIKADGVLQNLIVEPECPSRIFWNQ
jgi:hypothetical protein